MKNRNFQIFTLIFFLLVVSCKEKSTKTTNTETEDARSKIIQAVEINSALKAGKDIAVQNATIIGDIDFTEAGEVSEEIPDTYRHYVNSSFSLVNCTVKGKIIGSKSDTAHTVFCTFRKNVSLLNCTVQDTIMFKGAEFGALFYIRLSNIEQTVFFNNSRFSFSKSYFSENNFYENVNFPQSEFRGEVAFFRSKFNKHAIFQAAIFVRDAQFSSCKFEQSSDFSGIETQGGIFFNYAEFSEKMIFSHARFGKRAEFVQAKIKKNLDFKNAVFASSAQFTKIELDGEISLERTLFIENLPDFGEAHLTEGSHINLNGALTTKKEQVVISGLKKEKN